MKNLFLLLGLASVIGLSSLAPAMADSINGGISETVQNEGADTFLNNTLAFFPVSSEIPSDTVAIGAATSVCPKLSLSDEQLEKLYGIKNKFADVASLKKVELKSQSRKLKDLLTQTEIDRKQISQIQQKINQLKTELSDLCISMKVDSMEVLTAEQRTQLRHMKMRAPFGGKRHVWHKKHLG